MRQLIDLQDEIPIQRRLPCQRNGDDFTAFRRRAGKADGMAGRGDSCLGQFVMEADFEQEGIFGTQAVLGA